MWKLKLLKLESRQEFNVMVGVLPECLPLILGSKMTAAWASSWSSPGLSLLLTPPLHAEGVVLVASVHQ